METYIESNRGTGRTYRMLLQSLVAASAGKNVAVMCHSNSHAKWLWMRAREHCKCEATASSDHLRLNFPNGGTVYFHYTDEIRGIEIHETFTDEI